MAKLREKHIRGIFERERDSNIWWIHYHDSEGRRRREKVGAKSAAITLYRKRKTEALAGKKLPENLRQRQRTFSDFADLAIAYSNAHKRSAYDDSCKIEILRTEFGNRPADSLTQQVFTAFLESRSKSPATFNRYRATLLMIYREAIRNGWTERNPAKLIKTKPEPDGRTRHLLDEEEVRIRKVISADYPHFLSEFEIGLYTGMRKHEQFACEWDWVKTKAKQILLPGSVTKNGVPRPVWLNTGAIAALKRQRAITGKQSHVFMSSTGEPFPKKVNREWWDDACAKAGLDDFNWHCLRHTFCSRLAMAGVDLRTVQELAGHLTISVTAKYSHLSQPHLESAIEKISKTGTAGRKKSTATTTATGRK